MGPADLEEIIGDLKQEKAHGLLVGPGDDAGIYMIGDTAVVETVDIITPVVNDPFTFGAVSACNSLSDVYAMGGKPLAALAIAGFAPCDYPHSVLKEILNGAAETLKKAGVILIGGHSFDDPELKFGLSVTGVVNRDRILKVSGAREGDVIIMTKSVGIGVLSTALKGRKVTDAMIQPAINSMLTLNDASSVLAVKAGASACTDITGFGLLGHAWNMVRGSGTDFVIESARVPVLPMAMEMVDSGMVPQGAYTNLRFMEGKVDFYPSVSEATRLLLSDPQTSGGLLVTLKEEDTDVFKKSEAFFSVIGRVVKGTGRIFIK